jgi:chromosome segregation ATPase
MKNALVARLEAIAGLEMDNVHLRSEIEELSHDTLLEKSAALTVQLGKNEQTIADLTSEVEKQEALINAQKQTISDVTSRTSKMLKEFRQYQPSTLEPYDISIYLKSLQRKIVDFEGYLNTVTVKMSVGSKVF